MKPFENIVGKGENAGNQHFLLFPQCFLPVLKTIFNFSVTVALSSANTFNLDQFKKLLFGPGLNYGFYSMETIVKMTIHYFTEIPKLLHILFAFYHHHLYERVCYTCIYITYIIIHNHI